MISDKGGGQMNGLSQIGNIRKDILDAALQAGKTGAHLAPSLSLVELTYAVLKSLDLEQDSFILSKGHGALGYYAVMHQLGMITDDKMASFEQNGGDFPGQPSRSPHNGIEYSSGSLGMGLSYGLGRAFAKKQYGGTTYVVLGDGELNEGSVWEAAALAAQLKLDNLVAIIDNNQLQSDGTCSSIITMDLVRLFTAHGWHVSQCDGHSVTELNRALKSRTVGIPSVILAKTVKGKGVSFMENTNEWHHHVLETEAYEQAVKELGERYGLCKK